MNKEIDKKNIIKILGKVIMLISFIFIFKRVYDNRTIIKDVMTIKVAIISLLCACLYGLFIWISSRLYAKLLGSITDKQLSDSDISSAYIKANLYKYLPGNVMHLIGRNQIAIDNDISHTDVAFATVYEMFLSCLGSLSVSVLFSFDFVVRWLKDNLGFVKMIIVLVIILLLLIGIGYIFKDKIKGFGSNIKNIINRNGIRISLIIYIYYFFNQAIGGLAFIYILKAMGANIPYNMLLPIAGVYSFAWFIGFVTPGAPGGIGIRETMLTLLLQNTIAPGIIATGVILNRLITILGDIIPYLYTIIRKGRDR